MVLLLSGAVFAEPIPDGLNVIANEKSMCNDELKWFYHYLREVVDSEHDMVFFARDLNHDRFLPVSYTHLRAHET